MSEPDSNPEPSPRIVTPLVDQSGQPLPEFKRNCNEVRKIILDISKNVALLHTHPAFSGEQKIQGQHNEMHANLQLAYRHLEDARMRLGKSIQAYEGGVSIYDQ